MIGRSSGANLVGIVVSAVMHLHADLLKKKKLAKQISNG